MDSMPNIENARNQSKLPPNDSAVNDQFEESQMRFSNSGSPTKELIKQLMDAKDFKGAKLAIYDLFSNIEKIVAVFSTRSDVITIILFRNRERL